jgi:hypothetical protein
MVKKLKVIFLPCKENKFLPLFLQPKFLNCYLLILLLLKMLTLPLLYFALKTPFFAEISRYVILQMVNEERAKRGLPPLIENPILEKSAYLKARDILEKEYFSHYSPEGISSWYWFKLAGYDFKFAGENLAIGFLDSKEVHEALMNSASHKENILNPAYREIGISVLKGEFQGNEVYVVVEHFGTPKIIKLTEKEVQKEKVKKTLPETTTLPEVVGEKIQKEISVEKETFPKSSGSTVSEITQKIQFKTVEFIIKRYSFILNMIIYLSLIFLIFSLLATIYYDIFIYRRFIIDYKYLILRVIIFSLLLIFFVYLDQSKLVKIIPHKVLIYGF